MSNKKQQLLNGCAKIAASCNALTKITYEYVKPQFLLDDGDDYQNALEASWENSDRNDHAQELKNKILKQIKSLKKLVKQY